MIVAHRQPVLKQGAVVILKRLSQPSLAGANIADNMEQFTSPGGKEILVHLSPKDLWKTWARYYFT
jgi:hypothetical protein